MRTNPLHSARARFVATAATVFALVALGGVTTAPAYAAASALRVSDAATGQLWPYGDYFILTNLADGSQEGFVTDGGTGYWTRYVADGQYTLASTSNAYVPSPVTIVDGVTYQTIPLDTYKVSGTIPADAASGLTAAAVEYFNGTSWGPVGLTVDPTTVSAADGSFVFRAPQGPADYRLRLTPNVSTGYAETFVPFTITGSSPAVTPLGAITLNEQRSIGGTVYATDGTTPVVGATVHASQNGTDVATAVTDNAGAYRIQLPSVDGDYTVTATGTGFFAQEWDASLAGAEVVAVNATAGFERTGINFALDVEVVPIGGKVENWNLFGSALYAQLYAGGTATPTLIEQVEVSRTGDGEYVFSSVPTSGTYFIKFVPSGNDAFLDTLLGDAGYSEWSENAATDAAFSTAHPFSVSFTDVASYAENDVTIEQGVLFFGNFYGGSNSPVDGCVNVIDLDDPSFELCVQPDGNNQWATRVPVGHTYEFHAVENVGEYLEEVWDDGNGNTEVEAAYGGFYQIINFGLTTSPASLYGYVRDVSDTDPITVFLYTYVNGTFIEVASHATTAGSDEVFFDENYFLGYPGLAVGDYRVRFQNSDGVWLAANSHLTGRMPDDVGGTPATNVTCYLDIYSVTQGRPFFVDATFDVANQDPAACGPEPLDYRKVSGSVITTPTWGGGPVAGHTVLFSNDDNQADGVTRADGTFTVSYVPTGTFDLDIYPTAHVLGSHEYIYSGTGYTFNAGNVTLPTTLEAKRLGNAYGTILDWDDATMSGAFVTVYKKVIDPDGDYWQAGFVSSEVSATGYFEVPGIDTTSEYAVKVTFPATYAPVFLGGGYPTPTTSFNELAEQDHNLGSVAANPQQMVTISGSVSLGSMPLEDVIVIAQPAGAVCTCEAFGAITDEDGNYSIDVAPGVDYDLVARHLYGAPQILTQTYNGHNYASDDLGPYTFDPVTVGATDVTDINFSLAVSDEVFFDLWIGSWDESSGDVDNFAGVDVHIYKYVVDGWEEVTTVTSDIDAYAYIEAQGGGDYRLRFSQNGDWLAVHEQAWAELYYPFEDGIDLSEVYDPAQCYVDLDNVEPGSYIEAEYHLIADPTVGDCGPEVLAEHYEVFGTTVQSDVFNNDGIYGQTVTLTSGTGVVLTETTDSQGLYQFEGISPGTYTLTVPSVITGNGHAYVSYTQTVTVDDDEALTPIELTRYGNAEVGIYNWDASLAGSVAHLEIEGPAGTWTPIGLADVVDSTGAFVIPGISVDGDYRIWVDYPVGFVDGFAFDWYDPSILAVLEGDAEYDLGGTAVRAYTTVSGTVRLGATAVSGATVTVSAWATGDDFTTLTDAAGGYTVAVPAGGTYSVYGEKTGLVRDVLTTEVVSYVPRSAVDLAMSYATFFTETFDGTDPLTVHLYRKVTGGWQEVASDTFTEVMLWTTLSGDYRLRFSDGSDWLAVSEYEINGAQAINPVPNICYIDFAPAVGGTEYELLIEPVTPPTGVTCGAEPAVVAPPVTPGTTGSGTAKPIADFTTDAVAALDDIEPTATPTATPSPEATEEADEPTDENDETDGAGAEQGEVTPSSSPDLTWIFWVAGVLALFVLAGGAVFFVRRRI